jgi:transketolase
MREAFSRGLIELAQRDPRVVLLTGDHGYALFDQFRQSCPGQYINAGIAEQSMVGIAAGLAHRGFRPVVYGLSAFVPIRVLEQIKLDVAHDKLPVIFIGDGAGFVYGQLGTSHQCLEDIAALRSIAHVTIYSPADAAELSACMADAYAAHSCVYLRMGKADRGDVHQNAIAVSPTILDVDAGPTASGKLVFLATGSMVSASRQLVREHYPDARLYSVPRVHPMDAPKLIKVCADAELVVTLEEHCSVGGLGSAVTEILSQVMPRRVLRIGSEHHFSQRCGSYEYLLKEHQLDPDSIHKKIRVHWPQRLARPSI